MEFTSKKRLKVEVTGIVQGVGFRPFVYQLALQHSLFGYVLNNGNGVTIEIEGQKRSLENFLRELESKMPPLARIDTIKSIEIPTQNRDDFSIIQSKTTDIHTMVSADISICDDCKNEMNDPTNRRYKYPFINCTNCGPRYTIINTLPYDRKNTSMKKFPMCEECREEYEDPLNRRFHAQPISCYNCGVKLINASLDSGVMESEKDLVQVYTQKIAQGKTVAIKGVGGFHLVCDARDEKAVENLRLNKNRPTKPFAVMFKDINAIKEVCELSAKDEELILSKERPIVLINKKTNFNLAKSIAPSIEKLGVFLPYTPLHELLLSELDSPIVATSANLSDEPIIRDEKELFEKLPMVVQDALTNDREILNACDDSVIMSVGDDSVVLRLSRGYTPMSFFLPNRCEKKILALGANQKSTLTLAFDNNIVLSPHIGDLNSLNAFEYFERTLETFKTFYNFEPDLIVCDKHPQYETTKWARRYVEERKNIELLEVQHHYAHALACMAEHKLDEKCLAFCFDGTGYGDDETLWGGEVLVLTPQSYERVHHLQSFSLLGGEKAVKEPRRVALAMLFECFSKEEILNMDNSLVNSFSETEINTYYTMQKKGLNSPKSSSIGRLFDGVYALSGYLDELGYEGESGLIIERDAKLSPTDECYSYTLDNGVIGFKEMLLEILQEQNRNHIADKFLNTLTDMIVKISQKYEDFPVILSGGVFQNKSLVEKVISSFKDKGIKYYIQNQTPINDGGISLGQAYHALKLNL